MKHESDVKNRILEIAGEIFAERGYRETTVREICRRAGVNLAAVHYHFGDKERLYLAVLKHFKELAFQKYPRADFMQEQGPLKLQLAAFIKSFIFHILGDGQMSCLGKIMSRELIEPTHALDIIVEEEIRPFFNRLRDIVRRLSGSEVGEGQVILCSMSIVGQCLYFRYSRPVIGKLLRKDHFTVEEMNEIAEHITRFSLEAIVALSRHPASQNIFSGSEK